MENVISGVNSGSRILDNEHVYLILIIANKFHRLKSLSVQLF